MMVKLAPARLITAGMGSGGKSRICGRGMVSSRYDTPWRIETHLLRPSRPRGAASSRCSGSGCHFHYACLGNRSSRSAPKKTVGSIAECSCTRNVGVIQRSCDDHEQTEEARSGRGCPALADLGRPRRRGDRACSDPSGSTSVPQHGVAAEAGESPARASLFYGTGGASREVKRLSSNLGARGGWAGSRHLVQPAGSRPSSLT